MCDVTECLKHFYGIGEIRKHRFAPKLNENSYMIPKIEIKIAYISTR